jgi:hypothetical protein
MIAHLEITTSRPDPRCCSSPRRCKLRRPIPAQALIAGQGERCSMLSILNALYVHVCLASLSRITGGKYGAAWQTHFLLAKYTTIDRKEPGMHGLGCRDLGFLNVLFPGTLSTLFRSFSKSVPPFSSLPTMVFPYFFLSSVVVGYLVLVRSLRYRRIQQLQKQHGSTQSQVVDLHYKDAQKIIGQMGLFEFPWIFLTGKDFAFLRVTLAPYLAPPKTVLISIS